jgi:hypothetical protein
MSSDRELLIVRLNQPAPVQTMMDALRDQLPRGIDLLKGYLLPADTPVTPSWARYELTLSDRVRLDQLDQMLDRFNAAAQWPIQRANGKIIDLTTGIDHIQRKNNHLCFTVNIDPAGTCRIDEVKTALALESDDQVRDIRRTDVGYPGGLADVNSDSSSTCH